MNSSNHSIATLVFGITIIAAFAFSAYGRIQARRRGGEEVWSQGLNRWLVGLSAGATANSGFVVTGAVGLGYTFGLQWVALPLAWFLGDLVFWKFFPQRINALGREQGANTVADIITTSLSERSGRTVRRLIAVIVLCCLGGYTAAQWLAGEKFVVSALGLPAEAALLVFAAIIVSYTAIGGFRGSVYTDSYQAVLRLIATTLAIVAVAVVAFREPTTFQQQLDAAGPDFLTLFPGMSLAASIAFVLGYAAASLGFGLGQPQVLTRYMSASSPEEAQAAKWIYIFFVQYTWIAMTLFGLVLRGVMPGLDDGETGLAAFFIEYMPSVLTGVIIADIFATIAATANSLIIAMAQTVRFDLLGLKKHGTGNGLLLPAIVIGLVTMGISLTIQGSVVTLALSSVAVMGAGLAPSVFAQLFRWNPRAATIALSIAAGAVAAVTWKIFGFDAVLNEALPGMLVGLAIHCISRFFGSRSADTDFAAGRA